MYIIGENIHIISPAVKVALKERDGEYFKKAALQQVEAGAQCVDLNLGPRKKDWEEVFPWMVKTVEEVVDVPLCIDTTNVFGMEAALRPPFSLRLANSSLGWHRRPVDVMQEYETQFTLFSKIFKLKNNIRKVCIL